MASILGLIKKILVLFCLRTGTPTCWKHFGTSSQARTFTETVGDNTVYRNAMSVDRLENFNYSRKFLNCGMSNGPWRGDKAF